MSTEEHDYFAELSKLMAAYVQACHQERPLTLQTGYILTIQSSFIVTETGVTFEETALKIMGKAENPVAH